MTTQERIENLKKAINSGYTCHDCKKVNNCTDKIMQSWKPCCDFSMKSAEQQREFTEAVKVLVNNLTIVCRSENPEYTAALDNVIRLLYGNN